MRIEHLPVANLHRGSVVYMDALLSAEAAMRETAIVMILVEILDLKETTAEVCPVAGARECCWVPREQLYERAW